VLRGVGLATTSTALSLAAHAAAGGALPAPGTTFVVTSSLAGAGIALADRRRGRRFIVAALGANQLVIHLVLQHTNTDSHAYSAGLPLSAMSMFWGHAAAAILTGLMLARAELALFAMARLLGLILPRKSTPFPITLTRPACAPWSTDQLSVQSVRSCGLVPRAPPALLSPGVSH
jgi:hypothetical protein